MTRECQVSICERLRRYGSRGETHENWSRIGDIMIRATLVFAFFLLSISATDAAEDRSILTYHGTADRSGNFVVPTLTGERARGVHLDTGFQARLSGHLYAQPLYWPEGGTNAGLVLAATESNEVPGARRSDWPTGVEPLPWLLDFSQRAPLREYQSSRRHRHTGDRSGRAGDLCRCCSGEPERGSSCCVCPHTQGWGPATRLANRHRRGVDRPASGFQCP
jgi:hypothetical protein